MAKASKKLPKKQPRKVLASSSEQEVVITGCAPNPNPVTLSRSGSNTPNTIFFVTNDRDRVYAVEIKGKVFVGKKSKFTIGVWYGNTPEHLTVDSNAKLEKFKYKISAAFGPTCSSKTNLPDPPEIIVEA